MAVIIGGRDIRNTPEQVSKNTLDIEELKSRDYTYKSDVIDNLSSYQTKKPLSANQGRILKQMLDEAIAGVFHYKGSVATYADLPSSGMEIGDTYNVLDTGNNFTWDGTGWDQLSGLVDLSAYYTKTESDARYVDLATAQTIEGEKTFNSNIIVADNKQISSLGTVNIYGYYGTNTTGFILGNGSISFTRNLVPSTSNQRDIGSSSSSIKDLYLSGKAYLPDIITSNHDFTFYRDDGTTPAFVIGNASGVTTSNYTIKPRITNTVDLGTSSYLWKDLYLSGTAYISDWYVKQESNGYWSFRNSSGYGLTGGYYVIQPLRDNEYSLGSINQRFKDVYISGNLSDGTNTATVADLAALIAYAKAQGWIS